jgi:hypothetical protein
MHADMRSAACGPAFSRLGHDIRRTRSVGMEMEKDVEIRLTSQLASMEAVIAGFAKDVNRRFDDQAGDLKEIRVQVTATNGRVSALETANKVRAAIGAIAATPHANPVVAPAVITLSDIKWWLYIAIGCLTAGAGFTVWILKLVGKL